MIQTELLLSHYYAYADGAKTYIIAQNGLQVGQKVVSGEDAAPEIGNTLPLSKIPLGNSNFLY